VALSIEGRMLRRLFLIPALLVAVWSSGCANMKAYQGPELRHDEAAVLRVVNHRAGLSVWNALVIDVDGQAPPFLFRATQADRNMLFDSPASQEKLIELAPGTHALKLGLFWDDLGGGSEEDGDGHCTLRFTAEPGQSYDLRTAYWRSSLWQLFVTRRDWTAWVVDRSTGATVSTDACVPAKA
jgi:hypothetical protein